MFILKLYSEKLRISPEKFVKERQEIEKMITFKYGNKLIQGVGLVICMWDIVKLGDAHVFSGDGAAWIDVDFRLAIFQPCIGEIMTGKVVHGDEEGLVVDLCTFYKGICIPTSNFGEGVFYDKKEEKWCWCYNEHNLYFYPGDYIRFSLDALVFNKPLPSSSAAPLAATAQRELLLNRDLDPDCAVILKDAELRAATARAKFSSTTSPHVFTSSDGSNPSLDPSAPSLPPLIQLIATVDMDGLGMLSWWSS